MMADGPWHGFMDGGYNTTSSVKRAPTGDRGCHGGFCVLYYRGCYRVFVVITDTPEALSSG